MDVLCCGARFQSSVILIMGKNEEAKQNGKIKYTVKASEECVNENKKTYKKKVKNYVKSKHSLHILHIFSTVTKGECYYGFKEVTIWKYRTLN